MEKSRLLAIFHPGKRPRVREGEGPNRFPGLPLCRPLTDRRELRGFVPTAGREAKCLSCQGLGASRGP